MKRPPLYVELCCGSAATMLALLLGLGIDPLVGYMGGKRRFSRRHLEDLGLEPGLGAEEVLLVDAGPWGETWQAVLDPIIAPEVAGVAWGWVGQDPRELWDDLASQPPAEQLSARVAQWLWLQGRSASSTPVWWASQEESWRMADKGGRVQGIYQTGGGSWMMGAAQGGQKKIRPKGTGYGKVRGLQRPETLARRIEALAPLWTRRIAVHHGDVAALWPEQLPAGTVVVFDPPYRGATGYPADCPRWLVVEVALRWAAAGAVVLVCEAEAIAELVALGWHAYEVTHLGRAGARPEWITMSRPRAQVRTVRRGQLSLLDLFSEAA